MGSNIEYAGLHLCDKEVDLSPEKDNFLEDNLKAGKTRDRHNSDAEKAFNINGVEPVI